MYTIHCQNCSEDIQTHDKMRSKTIRCHICCAVVQIGDTKREVVKNINRIEGHEERITNIEQETLTPTQCTHRFFCSCPACIAEALGLTAAESKVIAAKAAMLAIEQSRINEVGKAKRTARITKKRTKVIARAEALLLPCGPVPYVHPPECFCARCCGVIFIGLVIILVGLAIIGGIVWGLCVA